MSGTKYAVAMKYYFAIVKASEISDVFMKKTSIHVCVDGIIYEVYEGKTDKDQNRLEEVIERHRKLNLLEYLI